MRSLVSSSGTDLGVWYSKRHRRWTRVSVHLYHSQLITGVVIFLFTLLHNFFVINDGEGSEFCLATQHVVATLLQTGVNKTC